MVQHGSTKDNSVSYPLEHTQWQKNEYADKSDDLRPQQASNVMSGYVWKIPRNMLQRETHKTCLTF